MKQSNMFQELFLYYAQPYFQPNLFILRGSFVTKQWVSPYFIRHSQDIDFLANFPYNKSFTLDIFNHILENIKKSEFLMFENQIIYDEITFQDTWIESSVPSLKLIVKGFFENTSFENTIKTSTKEYFDFSADIAFGDTLVDVPVIWNYHAPLLNTNISMLVASHTQALAWKIHGLVEFYEKGYRWQFKDVYDIYAICKTLELKGKTDIFFELKENTLEKCLKQAFLDKKTDVRLSCKKIFDGSFGQSTKTTKQWTKFLEINLQHQFTTHFPPNISHLEVIKNVCDFILPYLRKI